MKLKTNSYIICSTPRTGSTLLCDLLASTKVAGNPDSFFMRDVDPVWTERWGLPDRGDQSDADRSRAYLAAAINTGRGGTGVFGLRLMREDLGDLIALIDKVFPGLQSDKARLRAAFGNVAYIHLARDDKLAQAISVIKAEQTGLWHIAPDGTELERVGPPKEPEYDFNRIAGKIAQLEGADAAWSSWFQAEGIEPFLIEYEKFSADPATFVAHICRALGVTEPASESLRPSVAKLSDGISSEWVRRYREDCRRSGP
ncbi:MAG: Stf0 family sulfotransferase [Hyphomicrobiaceae bacterium]